MNVSMTISSTSTTPSPSEHHTAGASSTCTSHGKDDSVSGESLPSLRKIAAKHLALQSRQGEHTNTSTYSIDNVTSASASASASAATSVSGGEPVLLEIDAMTPCLEAYHGESRSDAPKAPSADVSFDVDSTWCFPSSLAHATVNKAANLSASVH